MRAIAVGPILCLAATLLTTPAAPARAQDYTRDPDAVRLVVDDIRRLAEILRSLEPADDTIAAIERDYLAQASPGLTAYRQRYDVTAASIVASLTARGASHASLAALADSILARDDELRTAFRRLQDLFPDAVYPPIWFFVGGHGTRGLARPEGVLVSAEGLIGRPDDVVPLVLHELAHFPSAMIQGVEAYRRVFGPDGTLLGLALREGTAELVAELTTGRHINPAAERYGRMREAELWREFSADMHDGDPGDWMFAQPQDPERPADLGYWIGYRIAQSYFEQADDERQAIREILGVTDFTGFLDASGYAARLAR